MNDPKNDAGDCCPDCETGIAAGRAELERVAAETASTNAADVLAVLAEASKQPAFAEYIKRKHQEANERPAPRVTPTRAVEHTIDFTCEGRVGDVIEVRKKLHFLFRGEKIMATDTTGGLGTRMDVTVAGILQRPKDSPRLLTEIGFNNPLGCGIRFEMCRPSDELLFTVEFLKDCRWDAAFMGRAVFL